jgi:2'-5' RNA ligase
MRLFVGIAIPAEVGLALDALAGGVPGADWIDPASYHVTLRFIGEVGRSHAEEIDAALAEIVAPGFGLSIARIDLFQTAGRPRTLWAGVDHCAALNHLARKIDRAVVRTDLPAEDRAFTPHVTIARLRKATLPDVMTFIERHALFRAPHFSVDRFTLYESRQGGGGPVYIPLVEYGLVTAAG